MAVGADDGLFGEFSFTSLLETLQCGITVFIFHAGGVRLTSGIAVRLGGRRRDRISRRYCPSHRR
jgi:hypothetical protein